MNDLPNPVSQGNPNSQTLNPKQDAGSALFQGGSPANKQVPPGTGQPAQPITGGSFAKEKEVFGSIQSPEVPLRAVGTEVALPKEVASAGVKVHPTSVPVPPPVAQMGVKVVADNVPVQTTATSVVLPLTDDQIAQGLSQSIETSWRWLAEWCKRRLLKFHIRLKATGGHGVRENE